MMPKRAQVPAVCLKCRKRITVYLLAGETLQMRSCVDFLCPGKLVAVGATRAPRRPRENAQQTTLFSLKGK